MFKNCIFDLYGTLVDIRTDEEKPSLWHTLSSRYAYLGVSTRPEVLKARYEAYVKDEEERLSKEEGFEDHFYAAEIDLTRVFARLFASKEITKDSPIVLQFAGDFRKLSMEKLRLYDGAAELLKRLKREGKGVYLLSNAQRCFTYPELVELGIAELFDAIYISSDYGRKKPDSVFYQALLSGEGLDPSESIMVGNDGCCDISGAKNVGLSTLYIHSEISPKEALPPADFLLSEPDMQQVAEILLA